MSMIDDRDPSITAKPDFEQNSKNNDQKQEKDTLEKHRATPKPALDLKPDGMTTKTVHETVEINREKRINQINKPLKKPANDKNIKREFKRSGRTR